MLQSSYVSFFALLASFSCLVHSNETNGADGRSKRFFFTNPDANMENLKEWKLRYFPNSSTTRIDQPSMFHDRQDIFNISVECDDGQSHIANDYDGSPNEYTCSQEIFATRDLPAIIHEDIIPPFYVAPLVCIKYPIAYSSALPTYGSHRPIWAKYGEYKFLPRERWLHNAERGAVIMLYHPCANAKQVESLRSIVTGCLRRHIITPYKMLSPERPIVLLTWGWYLAMAQVDPKVVKHFITNHALQGHDPTSVDGKFDHLLMKPASIVSDEDDSVLCH